MTVNNDTTSNEPEHWISDLKRGRRAVIGGLWIAVASLLWVLVIPGVVAAWGGVFYRAGIESKLPAEAKAKLNAFNFEQAARRTSLATIDAALTVQTISAETVKALIHLRSDITEQIQTARAPISAIPFHLNPQLLLWPAIYASMGWLSLLLQPSIHTTLRERLRSPNWLGIGLIV